ncbi:MAG: hypothetical protein DRN66_03680 [Candidatus Nanohalarchaeota archaeon]|nr:MAG: hypothetical protein DRN66_03680 [Candidatus Nanohaloarchaeota archaeon]
MNSNNPIVKPCTEENVFEIRQKKNIKLNLENTAKCLKKKYKIIVVTPYLTVVENDKIRANIFKSGKLLIKNVSEDEAKKTAKEIEGCFAT